MSARAVKQMFDALWGELARSAGRRLCDEGKVIPLYLAHYTFEATLPTKDDLNYEFFGLVDEECETDDMDEFAECVNKVCDCVRLAQQFFNTLPQLLTVEVI